MKKSLDSKSKSTTKFAEITSNEHSVVKIAPKSKKKLVKITHFPNNLSSKC